MNATRKLPSISYFWIALDQGREPIIVHHKRLRNEEELVGASTYWMAC